MAQFHDERDNLRQLRNDVEWRGHTPHSVQESAEQELRRRGYSERQIDRMKDGESPDEQH